MKHGVLLIGCGAMANVHCQTLSKMGDVRLVGAVDVDLERAASFQKLYGFERIGCDYRAELERRDFDIVLSATHWSHRFEMIRDCFDAGKHVLAEKPLSIYVDEVDALFRMAQAKGLKLRVGMLERFRPLFKKVVELIEQEVIGRPKVYSLMHHQRPAPSQLEQGWSYFKRLLAGGVTPNIDCGIHKCDLVRMFTGADAVRVVSVGQKLESDSPSANFAHSVFWMSDGSTFTLEDCFSRTTEPFVHMWMLGENGRMVLEYAGSHDRPLRGSEEDVIHLWRVDKACHETLYTPAGGKAVGPQMTMLMREIDEDLDIAWHYRNVRQATEMVIATALSEHRGEIVSLPLTDGDHGEVREIIQRAPAVVKA